MSDGLRTGTPTSRGEFLLHQERAREKLQQFQLVSPHHYVLEFLKAAWLLKATRVEFSLDSTNSEVRFDGQFLRPLELQTLYGAAFATRETDRKKALRHLAIGVNAAQGIGLRELRIEVGDSPAHGVCLSGDEIEVLNEPQDCDGETRISLRQWTVRPSHLIRFFDKIRDQLPEIIALRERAAYCRIPVVVNGEQISRGLKTPNHFLAPVAIEQDRARGVVATTTESQRLISYLVQYGVLIAVEQRVAPFSDFGTTAFLESPALTPNLTQSAFVEDQAFNDLQEVIQHGALRSLARLCNILEDDEFERRKRALRRSLIVLFSYLIQPDFPLVLRAELTKAVENVPLFDEVNQPPGTPTVSLSWARTTEADGRSILRIHTGSSPMVRLPDGARAIVFPATLPWAGFDERFTPETLLAPFADEIRDLAPSRTPPPVPVPVEKKEQEPEREIPEPPPKKHEIESISEPASEPKKSSEELLMASLLDDLRERVSGELFERLDDIRKLELVEGQGESPVYVLGLGDLIAFDRNHIIVDYVLMYPDDSVARDFATMALFGALNRFAQRDSSSGVESAKRKRAYLRASSRFVLAPNSARNTRPEENRP